MLSYNPSPSHFRLPADPYIRKLSPSKSGIVPSMPNESITRMFRYVQPPQESLHARFVREARSEAAHICAETEIEDSGSSVLDESAAGGSSVQSAAKIQHSFAEELPYISSSPSFSFANRMRGRIRLAIGRGPSSVTPSRMSLGRRRRDDVGKNHTQSFEICREERKAMKRRMMGIFARYRIIPQFNLPLKDSDLLTTDKLFNNINKMLSQTAADIPAQDISPAEAAVAEKKQSEAAPCPGKRRKRSGSVFLIKRRNRRLSGATEMDRSRSVLALGSLPRMALPGADEGGKALARFSLQLHRMGRQKELIGLGTTNILTRTREHGLSQDKEGEKARVLHELVGDMFKRRQIVPSEADKAAEKRNAKTEMMCRARTEEGAQYPAE